mmetsp:Transcript_11901/g.21461  ORF Transcript_11901/g.21461 Transcript_11901/m.21461 type:complete len:80 (-) Transcript_11901:1222-1461(-)
MTTLKEETWKIDNTGRKLHTGARQDSGKDMTPHCGAAVLGMMSPLVWLWLRSHHAERVAIVPLRHAVQGHGMTPMTQPA